MSGSSSRCSHNQNWSFLLQGSGPTCLSGWNSFIIFGLSHARDSNPNNNQSLPSRKLNTFPGSACRSDSRLKKNDLTLLGCDIYNGTSRGWHQYKATWKSCERIWRVLGFFSTLFKKNHYICLMSRTNFPHICCSQKEDSLSLIYIGDSNLRKSQLFSSE